VSLLLILRVDFRDELLCRTNVAPFILLLIAAAILASCITNRTDTLATTAAPAPFTQSKAAEQCWMETEHGDKSLPLDKRAKVVDQCVNDKMKAVQNGQYTGTRREPPILGPRC
jgi:ABC-type enterochelin transport system substrate-binding protein